MSSSTGKAFDWKIFARLYSRSRPYRTGFSITAVLVVVLALLSPIRPEQMRIILDEMVPNGDHQGIIRVVLGFVGILIAEAVIQYYQTMLANKVAQSVTFDLRAELFRHVSRFKLSYFDKTPVGQLVTRHISDIDGIAEVFSVGLLDIIRDCLKLIVIISYMFWIDWQMTLIVLLPVPVLIYATRLFQKAVHKSFNDVRNEVSRINVFIQEHVTGMNIVQIFHREQQEQRTFEEINREHRNAHIRGIWAYSVFFPVVELLSAASVALMLWWGLRGAIGGQVSAGLILEFSMFITMMYRPIRQMADNFNVLQMGVVNAERVFAVLDTHEEQQDKGTITGIPIRGHIRFDDVWFAYQGEQWVIRDLNLEIREGEMVAIVGMTGAGKSSIAGLLNRFYDHQRGSIAIDGRDIKDYSLESLRTGIGLVLQDVFLFSDSIYNNLRLGDPSITREQAESAARAVGVDEFIRRLPGGYDFNVRERGGMLSTGQRQLLAFVRAYLQNPAVLVLDEATSSIDTESELLIRKATTELTRGRTSIVIAHRLSTVRSADRIIVLDKGVIAESGTHEELMARNGIYRKLVELQFGDT